MNKTVSNILIIVFSAVIAFSGFRLFTILREYHEGDKQYKETATSFVEEKEPDPAPAESSTPAAAAAQEAPDPTLTCPISVDFGGLTAQNPDVVGWIYSEGTKINYPVLRGADNDAYLHHMISGEYNSAGSIFMDYRCAPDLSGLNTIIYGHHMKNGSMFASLHEYTDQSFYDEHKYLWYLTPSHIYRLDVICGYVGQAEAEIYTIFENKDELDSYLSRAISKSSFKADSIPENIDRIVALSTCSYEYDDARYVVICVPVLIEK